jgi:hypothetical protein
VAPSLFVHPALGAEKSSWKAAEAPFPHPNILFYSIFFGRWHFNPLWPLMMQVVDLGIHSFRQTHLGGQCLLSRATATLMLGDNIREIGPIARQSVDFNDAWITLKRELSVDVYIEAYLDSSIAIPNLVKEAVETVQDSLVSYQREVNIPSLICSLVFKQIGLGHYLQISRISHDYHGSADTITLHVSLILCEEPNRLPRSLPGRLPRRVRGCAVDPHPPPGIDRATLSHIEIHMKNPRLCTPWGVFLTRLWLKDLPNAQILESSDEEDTDFRKNRYIVSLRPRHPSSLSSSLSSPMSCGNSDVPIEDSRDLKTQHRILHQSSNECSRDGGSGLSEKSRNLNELLSFSIFSLVSKPSRPPNNGVDKTTFDEGPRLSKIAPVLFRPGYYEVNPR